MRNLLAGFVLTVSMAITWAEPRTLSKRVMCDDVDTVLKAVTEEYKETPQWYGYNPQQNATVMLTVNLTTGAWTMIEFNKTTACIIAVGERSSSRWGTPV